jgi:hypothetical protein
VEVRWWRHYETSHLPGAINLLYGLVDEAERVLRDKRAEIVVYCMNEECEASRQEARELEEMGYENVVHCARGKQDRLPSARSSRVRWPMRALSFRAARAASLRNRGLELYGLAPLRSYCQLRPVVARSEQAVRAVFSRWITRLREPNAGTLGYVPKRKDAS